MIGNCRSLAVDKICEFDLAKLYSNSFLKIGVQPGYFDDKLGQAFLVSAPVSSLSNFMNTLSTILSFLSST